MKLVLVILIIGMMCIAGVSAYICINPVEDNNSVQQFKTNVNILAFKNDIEQNQLTEEGLYIKLKYFGPCKK